ncbi:amino acid ABC transporter substrate-binding protein [Xinfangfangia sp. D13-10-4-6]|uniref:substrate-binding periplasmic protein n=1 Tax=Pseudogemmobacter hezensis TaxID=2737662 RepID=UPI0015558B9E|nr:transporter substrate-binding domain-containing protein [Pseudogemmobacter hezensis]NPD16213.1 amino acid ABC transporter substrate-binding protein [Pseudogemmobacter hezensis]
MSCIASISAISATVWLAASGPEKPLVIGTEDSFPPYILRDEAGNLSGMDYEIMIEICTRNARDCEWRTAPFSELIPGVAEGRFDVVLGGMAITPERRALVDMSIPYSSGGAAEWFVGKPGAPEPSEARISVEAGTMQETWLRKEALDFRSYGSEAAALNAVASGAADLALGPFNERPDLEHLIFGQGLGTLYWVEIPDEGTGIAVCKGSELKAMIDHSIQAMEADGTLDKLYNDWF